MPVHSVGLDAPLLLLVNLGFCRTPVGEGALVHHGANTATSGKGEIDHCYLIMSRGPDLICFDL